MPCQLGLGIFFTRPTYLLFKRLGSAWGAGKQWWYNTRQPVVFIPEGTHLETGAPLGESQRREDAHHPADGETLSYSVSWWKRTLPAREFSFNNY